MVCSNPVCYKIDFQSENIKIMTIIIEKHNCFHPQNHLFYISVDKYYNMCHNWNSVSRSSIVDEGGIYFIEFCQLLFFKNEKKK